MADDFKSYFNQLRLAPSEYHKTGTIRTPRAEAGHTQFATDTALGFGIKMTSNVAQRFGTFLVNCMRHIVDQEEQKWTKEKRAAIRFLMNGASAVRRMEQIRSGGGA